MLDKEDIKHLISRLRDCVDLLKSQSPHHRHMAAAKLLADISALEGIINKPPQTHKEG